MSHASPQVVWELERIIVVDPDDDSKSNRERPTKVVAILGDRTSPKSPVPHPLALIDADTKDTFPTEGMDKGHVIARRFLGGAADVSKNIVPLHPTFNRAGGLWSDLEGALAKAGPTGIEMTVVIKYLTKTDVVPNELVVTAKQGTDYVAFNDKLSLNQLRFQNLHTTPVKLTDPEILDTYDVTQDLIDELKECIKLTAPKWRSEWDFVEKYSSWYPKATSKPLVGGDPGDRLYSVIDFAHLDAKGAKAIPKYMGKEKESGGRGFSQRQRALIKIMNRLRNKGWLMSDVLADPHAGQPLSELSGPTSAAIDHVYPKAKSGWNCFSNALLVSEKYNKSKTDTLSKDLDMSC